MTATAEIFGNSYKLTLFSFNIFWSVNNITATRLFRILPLGQVDWYKPVGQYEYMLLWDGRGSHYAILFLGQVSKDKVKPESNHLRISL